MRALWSILIVAALPACAGRMVDVGRPPITVQGYTLAAAPASDAHQFLGRRYQAPAGDLGDRPCGDPAVEEARSSQRLSAEYSGASLAKVDAALPGVLAGAIDVSRLESVRVELTTTRKASVTVPSGCAAPVVYDALAGSLYVEYRGRDGLDLAASVEPLRARALSAGAGYQIDERRRVVSVTLASDEFVAFRVHQPDRRRAWGAALIGGGGALLAAGGISDALLARDGEDGAAEWIPVALYTAGAILGISGALTWRW
jgi:hypothetical protein